MDVMDEKGKRSLRNQKRERRARLQSRRERRARLQSRRQRRALATARGSRGGLLRHKHDPSRDRTPPRAARVRPAPAALPEEIGRAHV